jgi:hypothetical protein
MQFVFGQDVLDFHVLLVKHSFGISKLSHSLRVPALGIFFLCSLSKKSLISSGGFLLPCHSCVG